MLAFAWGFLVLDWWSPHKIHGVRVIGYVAWVKCSYAQQCFVSEQYPSSLTPLSSTNALSVLRTNLMRNNRIAICLISERTILKAITIKIDTQCGHTLASSYTSFFGTSPLHLMLDFDREVGLLALVGLCSDLQELGDWKTCRHSPDDVSHTRTERSRLPLAKRLPSGLHVTLSTKSECPRRVCMHLPLEVSHTCTRGVTQCEIVFVASIRTGIFNF